VYVVVFCGVFEQQKIYVVLSASFGTQIFYCEGLVSGSKERTLMLIVGFCFSKRGICLVWTG